MVVLSREDPDAPCALAICAPLTTAYRGSECEVDVGKPRFLRMHSYVNVQGLQAVQHRGGPQHSKGQPGRLQYRGEQVPACGPHELSVPSCVRPVRGDARGMRRHRGDPDANGAEAPQADGSGTHDRLPGKPLMTVVRQTTVVLHLPQSDDVARLQISGARPGCWCRCGEGWRRSGIPRRRFGDKRVCRR